MSVRSVLPIGRIQPFPTLNSGQHRDDQSPALHTKHGQQLAYALADVIAVDPYPLAGAWPRLLDDCVAVVVDVGWCGQATPEYCIRAGRALRVIAAQRQARATQNGKSVRISVFRFGIDYRSSLILTAPKDARKSDRDMTRDVIRSCAGPATAPFQNRLISS